MLRVSRLAAGYHGGRVLHDVDLSVAAGTVHAVVGRNGAGKSTLVHAIAGLLRPYAGSVQVGVREVAGAPAHRIARAGVGLVPQGRRVFASLTVAEHLTLSAGTRRRGWGGDEWTVDRVLDVLPRLAERLRHRGDQLSGGEQQMLAIGRALLTQPRVLLLDEPCEGLAGDLAVRVGQIIAGLAGTGISVLLVEQQLDRALDVADRITVLDYGRVVHSGPTDEVRADPGPLAAVLSVAHATSFRGTAPSDPAESRESGTTKPGPYEPLSHDLSPYDTAPDQPAARDAAPDQPAPPAAAPDQPAPPAAAPDQPAPPAAAPRAISLPNPPRR